MKAPASKRDYYHDVGHHIDDCKALKDFIQGWLWDDYFWEYIAHYKHA